jgi:hypothetical protein
MVLATNLKFCWIGYNLLSPPSLVVWLLNPLSQIAGKITHGTSQVIGNGLNRRKILLYPKIMGTLS